jgi:hypothetical protein
MFCPSAMKVSAPADAAEAAVSAGVLVGAADGPEEAPQAAGSTATQLNAVAVIARRIMRADVLIDDRPSAQVARLGRVTDMTLPGAPWLGNAPRIRLAY